MQEGAGVLLHALAAAASRVGARVVVLAAQRSMRFERKDPTREHVAGLRGST